MLLWKADWPGTPTRKGGAACPANHRVSALRPVLRVTLVPPGRTLRGNCRRIQDQCAHVVLVYGSSLEGGGRA